MCTPNKMQGVPVLSLQLLLQQRHFLCPVSSSARLCFNCDILWVSIPKNYLTLVDCDDTVFVNMLKKINGGKLFWTNLTSIQNVMYVAKFKIINLLLQKVKELFVFHFSYFYWRFKGIQATYFKQFYSHYVHIQRS